MSNPRNLAAPPQKTDFDYYPFDGYWIAQSWLIKLKL